MRYYSNDDDDERENLDDFFEEDFDRLQEEYQDILEEEQINRQMEYDFVDRDLNHKTLRVAIRICEKSFWWKFLSIKTKLNIIQETYSSLRYLEEE